jgi:hypothetical protein
MNAERKPAGSYAWPCSVVGCHRRAPTHTMICLRCQHGGRLPERLGAWAWREAGRRALVTLEAAFLQPGGLLPRGWLPRRRPTDDELRLALRRVARCYRGAAYAVAESRGIGERAP